MEKIKIGISKCLLGEKVRYDGGHKQDHYITDTLGQYMEWFPVCPEVECGLPIPREAMHLVADHLGPRLMTIHTNIDHTDRMMEWAKAKLGEIEAAKLCGFIFKSRSPSSGMQGVQIYMPNGTPGAKGVGVFAGAFMARFPLVPAEDEEGLHDPALRENFIERVLVFHRWQELMDNGMSLAGLIEFHTRHKLLILSHSTAHYTQLGRLVASAKPSMGHVHQEYAALLMDALRRKCTVKKNANVLLHMAGYFKKQLSSEEEE